METNESNNPAGAAAAPRSANPAPLLIVTGAILAGLAGLGYGVYSQREAERSATVQQSRFQAAMSDMQQHVQILQDRLTEQQAKERERELTTLAQAAPSRKRAATQRAARPVDDPRFKQFEKRFSDQDEKLADTQRMVESARSDLENQLSSTSQELNGSIARTSEEVAALRRRGERNYFEFDIAKTKASQRVGPVGVALRKADVKHKRYNLDMTVDDNKLEKKNVNLLEPVYITSPEWPQPLELVVNRIDKDRIKGYISTPKYKRSELASSGAGNNKLESKPGQP